MAAETTTSALRAEPAAAESAAVADNNTAWGNSAWVTLIASTSGAITIAGVTFNTAVTSVREFEIDIGKGTAGSETVVATLRGNNDSGISGAEGGPFYLTFPIAISNIATGTRVAARLRTSGTGTTNWSFALSYYLNPVGGSITTTANPSLSLPSAATGVTLTPSGTAWANSAWAQITASTSSAIILAGIAFNPIVAVEFEIDVGKGGAGSETVVTTFRGYLPATADTPCFLPLETPLDNIATATRVAVRMRKAGTSTTAWTCAILYYNKPI